MIYKQQIAVFSSMQPRERERARKSPHGTEQTSYRRDMHLHGCRVFYLRSSIFQSESSISHVGSYLCVHVRRVITLPLSTVRFTSSLRRRLLPGVTIFVRSNKDNDNNNTDYVFSTHGVKTFERKRSRERNWLYIYALINSLITHSKVNDLSLRLLLRRLSRCHHHRIYMHRL